MKKYFTILFCFFIFNVFSQNRSLDSDTKLKIGSHYFPNPSVINLIKWLNMTTGEWENEIQFSELNNKGVMNGCVFYGSGASIDKATFTIYKCPGNIITVDWTDFTQSGRTVLDALVNDIEPYFKKTNPNLTTVYAFSKDEYIYEFTVSRENTGEFIIVRKIEINKK